MMRALRDLLLFFQRDLRIASTYRSPFVLEIVEALFGAATFYYVARFVDSPELKQSLPHGTTYFAYSLVGFAFFDYLHAALDSFDRSLEEARDTGTLEPLLVTQVPLPVIIAGSAVYPFLATTLRIAVYLGWGALLFGFPLHSANWLSVIVVLLATLLAFSGMGILSSAYLLLFKRGNPAKWFLLSVSGVAGGMLFPVSILPDWLQLVAHVNPVTYALDAMRSALLDGASVLQIARPLSILLLFAVILLPLAMATFSWALRRTKITGTLSHR
ncbi:MAG TPA: ABC transporter permease [Candidatus Saccharimonadales bacterium]|nr:ABC transporter permease [Candidatus Saccharimonadales bacterium]